MNALGDAADPENRISTVIGVEDGASGARDRPYRFVGSERAESSDRYVFTGAADRDAHPPRGSVRGAEEAIGNIYM